MDLKNNALAKNADAISQGREAYFNSYRDAIYIEEQYFYDLGQAFKTSGDNTFKKIEAEKSLLKEKLSQRIKAIKSTETIIKAGLENTLEQITTLPKATEKQTRDYDRSFVYENFTEPTHNEIEAANTAKKNADNIEAGFAKILNDMKNSHDPAIQEILVYYNENLAVEALETFTERANDKPITFAAAFDELEHLNITKETQSFAEKVSKLTGNLIDLPKTPQKKTGFLQTLKAMKKTMRFLENLQKEKGLRQELRDIIYKATQAPFNKKDPELAANATSPATLLQAQHDKMITILKSAIQDPVVENALRNFKKNLDLAPNQTAKVQEKSILTTLKNVGIGKEDRNFLKQEAVFYNSIKNK